ncbi:hypothetical protein BV898_09966 [Hypsibius exemplaris]|uniref:Uncharacterized protein n=1 Tax=Hypsibius exemplaris TaxID=2072580 RepID=A0A1W0WKX7_HYPEX|nr:hypothetical protein BV898_09966 [Hypsibius exemplaris]
MRFHFQFIAPGSGMDNLFHMISFWSGHLVLLFTSLAVVSAGSTAEVSDPRHGGQNLTLAAILAAQHGNASDGSVFSRSNATSLHEFLALASTLLLDGVHSNNRTAREYSGRTSYGDRHDTYTSGSGWGSSGVKRYGGSASSNYYKSNYDGGQDSNGYSNSYSGGSRGQSYGSTDYGGSGSDYSGGGGSDYRGGGGYGNAGGFYGQRRGHPVPVGLDNSNELLTLLLLSDRAGDRRPPVAAPAPAGGGLGLGGVGGGGLLAAGAALLPLLGSLPGNTLGFGNLLCGLIPNVGCP